MARVGLATTCCAVILFVILTAMAQASGASQHVASRTPSMIKSRTRGHGRSVSPRDAYTDLRVTQDGGNGPELNSTGPRPAGARAVTIPIGPGGAELFAWQSKTPHDESNATQVFIIIHGVKRNADVYWSILNNAYAKARDEKYGSADENSIRLAPLFFSAKRDSAALNATTLAWDDPNVWTGGDGSTHPVLSGVSVFTVLDKLVDKFTEKAKYPKMKRITILAHGGGGQVVQRYSVLGKDSPRSSVKLRYVVGDPSSMLYFTRDRPVPVDEKQCPRFNDFRYGFNDYTAPYSLNGRSEASLYKRYIKRDVRYAIGEEDTSIDHGDQSCMGQAAGGPYRRDRSLDYWAYLHLLGQASKIPSYPGWFPALDSDAMKAQANKNSTGFITDTSSAHKKFGKGAKIAHQLFTVPGAGHSAREVFGSTPGKQAIFGS